MPASRKRPLILVVDDEIWTVRMYRTLLERLGFATFPALDGDEAVDAARHFHPDLILAGVVMPKLSGIASAQRILEFAPDIKFIFISGSADKLREEFERTALHPRFPLLNKPAPIEELQPYLTRFLGKEAHA